MKLTMYQLGKLGGPARALALSPERRSEIASLGGRSKTKSLFSKCIICGDKLKSRNMCNSHRCKAYRRTDELAVLVLEFNPQTREQAEMLLTLIRERRAA